MPGKTVDVNLDRLASDEVVTTLHAVGDVEIKLTTNEDLSLITVIGPYSSAIGKAIDKIARRCKGSIGIEFQKIQRKGPKTAFDPSVIRLLNNLRAQCERKGEAFFMVSPPPKLQDMLRLAGIFEKYQIVDREGSVSVQKTTKQPRERRRGRSVEDTRTAGRRIGELTSFISRTASLEKGLDSAEKCVMRFLPDKTPEAPGYCFAFAYQSSEKVGGDFFDFIPLPDGRLGISIGDVSGHGLDAALIMGISKKVINIRAVDELHESPKTILEQVNVDIFPDLTRQAFVTALYGELQLDTGKFRFARAGHEKPILISRTQVETIDSRGGVLGLLNSKLFKSQIEDASVSIEPGDCLLLVTDGLAECRNEKEALYSRERLCFECGQLDTSKPAQELLDSLLESINSFAGKRSQEDDMTAILIQRLPTESRQGG